MDDHLTVPLTTQVGCLLRPPARPEPGRRPPLVVVLHGQGESGARQARWMGPAIPEHCAAAFPDGLHKHEVRRPGRALRLGHGWYLYTPDDRPAFLASLEQAGATLWRLIDAALERLDADPERVVLAGFSQGAYTTHYAALTRLERVRGWICQAGGFRPEYVGEPFPDLGGRPVLFQHGEQDEAIGPEVARQTADFLAAHGGAVDVRLYDTGHRIVPAMAEDARAWIEGVLPAGG